MRSETHKPYGVCSLVYPYQQKIILYVALHTAFVFAMQFVRAIFNRYDACFLEAFCYDAKYQHF